MGRYACFKSLRVDHSKYFWKFVVYPFRIRGSHLSDHNVSASLSNIYLHVIWSTWDRLPLLSDGLIREIYACIRYECRQLNVDVIAIGGIEDHVHLLVRLPTTVAVADFVKQVKGVSSRRANNLRGDDVFKWQGCYYYSSISKQHVGTVMSYIENQRAHHASSKLLYSLEPVRLDASKGTR